MVELKAISKRYGDHVAIRSLDLEIPTGKVTALIGPSGCGKSTLLRIILGLIEPSSGAVSIDGTVLTPENMENVRRETGYVIQDGGLFPHLTAGQNVTLFSRFLGHEESAIQIRLGELCTLTKFDPSMLERFPVELSGGQKQRVGLMRALMLKPKLLLLDEPLGALDPLVRAGLQTDLKEIFRSSESTVVFVTHDMGEAAYLADNIVLLREGQVIQQGGFGEFTDQPADAFVSEFLSAQRQVGAIV